jgi:hypothetical protein
LQSPDDLALLRWQDFRFDVLDVELSGDGFCGTRLSPVTITILRPAPATPPAQQA